MSRISRQENLILEVSAHGTLIAGECYSADYFEAIRRIINARGDALTVRGFSEADLPLIRSELALVAYERRRETRPLLDVLRTGEATPALQRLAAELLASGKALPAARPSEWRNRGIAVEVDRLRATGLRVGVARRRAAAAFGVSTSLVETAVRQQAAWLAARKAELPPGGQLDVWL